MMGDRADTDRGGVEKKEATVLSAALERIAATVAFSSTTR